MDLHAEEWGRKGATLSDKTARAEFGLTQDEIIAGIRAGKLQYRPSSIHGNPWLRLLRREVEDLVSSKHGERYLRERQARAELTRVNRELKQLRAQLAALEERRSVLLAELGELGPGPSAWDTGLPGSARGIRILDQRERLHAVDAEEACVVAGQAGGGRAHDAEYRAGFAGGGVPGCDVSQADRRGERNSGPGACPSLFQACADVDAEPSTCATRCGDTRGWRRFPRRLGGRPPASVRRS